MAEAVEARERAKTTLAVAAPGAVRLAAVGCGAMSVGALVQASHWLGLSRQWPHWAWFAWMEVGFWAVTLGAFLLLARLPGERRRGRAAMAALLAATATTYLLLTVAYEAYSTNGTITFPPWLAWLDDVRATLFLNAAVVLPVSLIVWLRLARIGRLLPSRRLSWVGRGMAVACCVPFVESGLNIVIRGDMMAFDSPVLVNPFVIDVLQKAATGDPGSDGGFIGLVKTGVEEGWLASLSLTPLAYASLAAFTVALLRAARRSLA